VETYAARMRAIGCILSDLGEGPMKRALVRTGTGAALGVASWLLIGCGGDNTRQLDPKSMAMTVDTAAFYDDGELKLFEVELPVKLPIRRPTPDEQKSLNSVKKVAPFDHQPWVTPSEVRVQLTWTLANLDKQGHAVEVLVDPWSEFGRYVPGVSMNGEKALPNFSGIQELYDLPGVGDTRSSRIQHTFTYDDMDELATDFATVINIIKTVKPTMNGDMVEDPRVPYVNHTFAVENRSGHDRLTDRYTPAVIPALLGFNLGLRTREKANVALEFTVEIVDKNGNRVLDEGSSDKPLEAPSTTITLGG
jgi:hypothetical protein